MSNEIQPFKFEGNKVRAMADGDEVMFVASDIAKTTGGDDQTVDMTLTAALRFSEKIGEKAYFVRTTAGKLRDADKKEARERDADEFMSRILKARIGGEA